MNLNKNRKKGKNSILTKKVIINSIIFIILLIFLFILLKINYNDVNRKKALEDSLLDIASLNEQEIFSIDKIYLYSSAYANNKESKKALWDLDVYQYTDIALYLTNTISSNKGENIIKELYIDEIKFNNLSSGTPNLYYKNIQDFGKFSLLDYNLIDSNKKFNFNIINTDIDYTKPQINSLAENPITLEYVNSNIKNPCILTDIENPLIYDGSLLKRCGIQLSSINCNISFKMHIINELGYKYNSTIYIDIPLVDSTGNSNIYSGNVQKETSDKITFLREVQ